MKTIFFTGKGGVGKSTTACTTAWQLAERGFRTLAISFDPAHNLGDIYDVKLSHKKHQFAPNLELQEADLDRAAEEYIRRNTDILTEVYSYTKAFNMDRYFKVLRHAPGVEEYAALTALETLLRTSTDYDYVVIDTPPTALTLRILALPRITITWIDRLRRIRRDILNKRHTVHTVTGTYLEEGTKLAYEEKDDRVMQKLKEMFDRYVEVARHLESTENQIAVVYNPDYLSLRESQRIFQGLDDLKLPISAALTNKYTTGLADIADQVEKELLSGVKPKPRNARVPWQPYRREKAYIMDFDLASIFL